MWPDADRAEVVYLRAEDRLRAKKVNDMVAWLRKACRALGEPDPTRSQIVEAMAMVEGSWDWLAVETGHDPMRPGSPTVAMVLERFPEGDQ